LGEGKIYQQQLFTIFLLMLTWKIQFTRSRIEDTSSIILRLMPDFTLIDIFDKNLNGDENYLERKRFQTISKKIIRFQKTHKLIDDFVNTGISISYLAVLYYHFFN